MPDLPFTLDEHLSRQACLRAALRDRGFDAMLVFAQESHFWLTGYDTGGFVFFQCAVVTADERPIVLLTRRPDLLQARQTSTIEDIRIWWDAEDANPARDLKVDPRGARPRPASGSPSSSTPTASRAGTCGGCRRRSTGFCTLDNDDHHDPQAAAAEVAGRDRLCAQGRRTPATGRWRR